MLPARAAFNPPVGDVVLAVDAVRVDGSQDLDAVPGAGSDLGGDALAFSQKDRAA
jgi:hypothetical protein